jgi:MYXO-CTERM domain-containing protein
VQHQGGPNYEVLNAHTRRGGLGTISNNSPPVGWSTSAGSLSGSSTFYSLMLPITWGKSWDVSVGLLAWAYGTSDNDFLTTAKLTGFEMFDAQQQRVMQFSVSAASGTDYVGVVPEASPQAMLLAGLGALWLVARRRTPLR